jgi:hypothetical protein
MLRPLALAVFPLATLLAVAATAEAKVFRGKTNQGRPAAAVIGSDALLRTASVNWRARCRKGSLRDKTIFLRPHDESTPDAFADSGIFRRTIDGGRYHVRFTASIRAIRIARARAERWRGTFHLKALITRHGSYVDTCRTRRLKFTLRPA